MTSSGRSLRSSRFGSDGQGTGPRSAAVILVTLMCVGLGACSAPRSVEAYCDVVAEHKERYVTAMSNVNSTDDPLSGLAGTVSALGDLSRMWEEAADVAPDDIRSDVEAVRDGWAQQFEAAEKMISDPLGGIAGSILGGLANAGSMARVDQYTTANCPDIGAMFVAQSPPPEDGVVSTPATTISPSAPSQNWVTAPSLTLLGDVGSPERVFGNDNLLVTVEDQVLRSYLPDGTVLGSYSGPVDYMSFGDAGERLLIDSGLQLITDASGDTHVYGLLIENLPAQGLDAPRTAYSLVSLDSSLQREWVEPLSVIPESDDIAFETKDLAVKATTDGTTIVVLDWYVVPSRREAHQKEGLPLSPAGRFVVTADYYPIEEVRVFDPLTGETVTVAPISPEAPGAAEMIHGASVAGNSWGLYVDDETAVTLEGLVKLPDGTPGGAPFLDENGSAIYFITPKVDAISRTILDGTGTLGMDVDTGDVRWQREDSGKFVLCGAGYGQALIAYEDQWVLLDAATGDQIKYLAGVNECPVVFGSIGVSGGQVYKLFDADLRS